MLLLLDDSSPDEKNEQTYVKETRRGKGKDCVNER